MVSLTIPVGHAAYLRCWGFSVSTRSRLWDPKDRSTKGIDAVLDPWICVCDPNVEVILNTLCALGDKRLSRDGSQKRRKKKAVGRLKEWTAHGGVSPSSKKRVTGEKSVWRFEEQWD